MRYGRCVVSDRHITPTGDPLTELALAEDLVTQHTSDLRYVRAWRSWVHWGGQRWGRDATGAVERLFKDLLRTRIVAATAITDPKQQKALITQILQVCTAPHVP